jgi:hypothetical protein
MKLLSGCWRVNVEELIAALMLEAEEDDAYGFTVWVSEGARDIVKKKKKKDTAAGW